MTHQKENTLLFEERFCVDCVHHFQAVSDGFHYCDSKMVMMRDPVDGCSYTGAKVLCYIARKAGGKCGLDGIYFSPKPVGD